MPLAGCFTMTPVDRTRALARAGLRDRQRNMPRHRSRWHPARNRLTIPAGGICIGVNRNGTRVSVERDRVGRGGRTGAQSTTHGRGTLHRHRHWMAIDPAFRSAHSQAERLTRRRTDLTVGSPVDSRPPSASSDCPVRVACDPRWPAGAVVGPTQSHRRPSLVARVLRERSLRSRTGAGIIGRTCLGSDGILRSVPATPHAVCLT